MTHWFKDLVLRLPNLVRFQRVRPARKGSSTQQLLSSERKKVLTKPYNVPCECCKLKTQISREESIPSQPAGSTGRCVGTRDGRVLPTWRRSRFFHFPTFSLTVPIFTRPSPHCLWKLHYRPSKCSLQAEVPVTNPDWTGLWSP